jgi:hypothetical protein
MIKTSQSSRCGWLVLGYIVFLYVEVSPVVATESMVVEFDVSLFAWSSFCMPKISNNRKIARALRREKLKHKHANTF